MKARIPNSAKLTKKQLQAAESYSRQVVKADQERLLRQYFKLMCYVLNRNFGFGSKRCLAVINGISRLSAEHDQDEIFRQGWRASMDRKAPSKRGLMSRTDEA